ncbi:sugar ABC transporter substrate-binding protein [Microbacterium sp. HD4P20]|uniref:sugar ABC transporter substrate-binding protein n=1 Tax=Microbacterium sp. HD4P20 TaxID=2864874 RepID=UPI001C63BF46|nr:sugar ABC transporter substrate-binding protein [Microbacterium sp. HD4P20]MCP2635043.1 sugar ABC transporter substrate-binding protein [Microbacterium sp. HD4P20]
MKHSIRITATVTAIAAGLVLSGCSTTTADDAGGGESAAPTERGTVDKILFDYPFTALPVYGAIVSIVEARAAEKGVEIVFTNDEMDLQKQVSQLNTFLTSDVDAVVSFPVDPASLEGIAQQYRDAGKYWVTYGGDMENQDATLQFSFYQSGYDVGQNAAEWALENVGPDAKVIVLNETERQIGKERTQGLLDGLLETAPDLQIVAEQQAVTPDEGLTVTTALLAQHPDVNIVVSAVGDAAQGAYQALVASGRAEDDPSTYVGGLDPNVFLLQKMQEGGFFRAATFFSLEELVANVIDIPIALGEGDEDASVDLPVTVVTADDPNLATYIAELGG